MEALGKHHGEDGHFTPPEDGIVPPLKVFYHVTKHGIVALWILFGLMSLAALLFLAMGLRLPKNQRVLYLTTGLMATASAIEHYSMAIQEGVYFKYLGHHTFRQLYFARYLGWLVSAPLLVLSLALLAGLSPLDTLTALVAVVAMVLTALFGGLTTTVKYQWGFFAFSLTFLLVVLSLLIGPGRSSAAAKSNATGKLYSSLALLVSVVWLCFPIVWALAEGSNRISVDKEIYFYGILEVLSIGVFGAWLLTGHEKIPEARVKISSFWTNGLGSDYDAIEDDS